jgi:hypothetical protein
MYTVNWKTRCVTKKYSVHFWQSSWLSLHMSILCVYFPTKCMFCNMHSDWLLLSIANLNSKLRSNINEKWKKIHFYLRKSLYLIPGPVVMESASSKPLSNDTSSYTCTAKQEIRFNNKNVTKYQYEIKMTISDVQIQAFDVHNTFSPGWFNIRHLYL